jgi:hypothetical protein
MGTRKSQNTKLRGLTFHALPDDSSPALRFERMLMR